MKKSAMIVTNRKQYIDEKGVGHDTGIINGKEYHLAGECGYVSDVLGNTTGRESNLTDEELDFLLGGE